jgi:hypothetical protein
MRGTKRRAVLVFGVGVLMSTACSVWNRVEACDSEPPAEVTVNLEKDRLQFLSTPLAVGALPSGGSVVTYDTGLQPPAVGSRLARLDPDGETIGKCGSSVELDGVVGSSDSDAAIRGKGAVVSPSGPDSFGLVAFEQGSGQQGILTSVWGQFFDDAGCLVGLPFQISTAADVVGVTAPTAVRVEGASENDDFAVFWLESRASVSGLLGQGRLVRRGPGVVATFPVTEASPAGQTTQLPLWGAVSSLASVALGEGRTALFWEETASNFSTLPNGVRERRAWMVVLDAALRSAAPPVVIIPWHRAAETSALVAATDGASLLVAWLQLDGEGGSSRLFSRALCLQGQPIQRADTGDDGPLRLGSKANVTDDRPAAVALANGGFLLGWTEGGSDADGGALRAIVLEGDGTPRFNSAACATTDFAVSQGQKVGQPAFARLSSGDILAAWTDRAEEEDDASGSVRGTILRVHQLLTNPARPAFSVCSAMLQGGPGECLPDAGGRAAGEPCRCSIDCAPGGRCMTEQQAGYPRGECVFSCDVDGGLPCAAGEVCSLGHCYRPCQTLEECPAGRRCYDRLCRSYCTEDDECESGHCDHYRGECTDGTPAVGAGLDAPCKRHDDCRSGLCHPGNSTCATSCIPSRPSCPEAGGCFPFGTSSEEGACHRSTGPGSSTAMMPCEETLDCRPGAGAQCFTEASMGYPRGACVIGCDSSHRCSAVERCLGHFCYTQCETSADCGVGGRVCSLGVCQPRCAQDEDCASGHCDPYSGKCGLGEPPTGLGLDAPCKSDEECRSGTCSLVTSTCSSLCQVGRSTCPEGAVCQARASHDEVGECHQPGTVMAGLPCRYPWECREGARCSPEAATAVPQEGYTPGGNCVADCQSDGGCASGEQCLWGRCWTSCGEHRSCPEARACSDVCIPFCVDDSECESRHCNRYTNRCDDGVPTDAGGVDAMCRDDAECNSGFCALTEARCVSSCKVSDPKCPEDAGCLGTKGDATDEIGSCHFVNQGPFDPCVYDQECGPGGECASEQWYGLPGGGCFFRCESDSECGAGETCGAWGACWRRCEAAGECGPGRMCDATYCYPFCASDADCRSGHCNLYRGRCDDGGPPWGRGIDAPCDAGQQCRSDICQASKCLSYCKVGATVCPEDAGCIPLDGGAETGVCHH